LSRTTITASPSTSLPPTSMICRVTLPRELESVGEQVRQQLPEQ
jgi:hypothetical protein